MSQDFTTVTELDGEEVTAEQVDRVIHRYVWAGEYCRDKDVLEVACGVGQGLGHLATLARSVRAGDITPALVARARAHYGTRIEITEMDAHSLPSADGSLDVVILFEAIYYLRSAEKFVDECRRVLRPGGRVLIVTANKDLYDFNPSPFSQRYYGVTELRSLFGEKGFGSEFFGVTPVAEVSLRQRILRPLKMLAVKFGLMPKTMSGKRFLKRLVFGKMAVMPAEIDGRGTPYSPPQSVAATGPDTRHKVIYSVATLR